MKNIIAKVAAITCLLGLEVVCTNGAGVTAPQIATSQESSGSTTVPQDPFSEYCKELSRAVTAKTNDEIWEYIARNLNDSELTCPVIVTCKLHRQEENVCAPTFEKATNSCYPQTKAGESAIVSCPEEFFGVKYKAGGKIIRLCQVNGTWKKHIDARGCQPVLDSMPCTGLYPIDEDDLTPQTLSDQWDECSRHLRVLHLINDIGNSLSLASATISFLLFWLLKTIRDWRIIIHWNLVGSYILLISTKFLVDSVEILTLECRLENSASCRVLVTFFQYFMTSTYFWMFVEGLHLHLLVVSVYRTERVRPIIYVAIGWGIPAFLTVVWAICKCSSTVENQNAWHPKENTDKGIDYILQVPIMIVLVLNLGILCNVVYIIFTKVKPAQRVHHGRVRGEPAQYAKALKAALLLFPLLGVTYMIYLQYPVTESKGATLAFWYFNAAAQSFQGFIVSTIYCFCNNEIRRAWSEKLRLWRTQSKWSCYWPNDRYGLDQSVISATLETRVGIDTQPSQLIMLTVQTETKSIQKL